MELVEAKPATPLPSDQGIMLFTFFDALMHLLLNTMLCFALVLIHKRLSKVGVINTSSISCDSLLFYRKR